MEQIRKDIQKGFSKRLLACCGNGNALCMCGQKQRKTRRGRTLDNTQEGNDILHDNDDVNAIRTAVATEAEVDDDDDVVDNNCLGGRAGCLVSIASELAIATNDEMEEVAKRPDIFPSVSSLLFFGFFLKCLLQKTVELTKTSP